MTAFFSLFVADAAPAQVEHGLQQTLFMVAIAIVFFYFIIWRPEQKRRKVLDARRNAMKKGDKIVVAGGILGEVFKIEKDTIIVKLSEGAKMEVMKGSIQDILPSCPMEQQAEDQKK